MHIRGVWRSLKIDSLRAYPVVNGLMEQVRDLESELSKSPLFTLWLQYINIIDIPHLNIYAERNGCWESYVKSVRLMLPYMAAANRDKYTKLLRWLLDEFEKIPEVKSQFLLGGFVVRTSTDNVYRCQYGKKTVIDKENRWVDKTVEFFECLKPGFGVTVPQDCKYRVWIRTKYGKHT